MSETAAMDLMVRRSGIFSSSLIQQGGRNGTRNGFRRPGRGRGHNLVRTVVGAQVLIEHQQEQSW